MATDTQNRPPLVSVEVVETVARGLLAELEAAAKALEQATDAARELERIAGRANYPRFTYAIHQEIVDLIALAKRPAAYGDGREEDDAS